MDIHSHKGKLYIQASRQDCRKIGLSISAKSELTGWLMSGSIWAIQYKGEFRENVNDLQGKKFLYNGFCQVIRLLHNFSEQI